MPQCPTTRILGNKGPNEMKRKFGRGVMSLKFISLKYFLSLRYKYYFVC